MEIKYCLRFFKVGSETCFVGFEYDFGDKYRGFKIVKVNYDYPDPEDLDGIVMIDVMVEVNTDEHKEGNAW